MNLLTRRLVHWIDAARAALGVGRPVTFRYQPSEGLTRSVFRATRRTTNLETGVQSGYQITQPFLTTARFVGDELQQTSEPEAEARAEPLGACNAADQQRMRIMAAMPSPVMTTRSSRDGAFIGLLSGSFLSDMTRVAVEQSPPEVRQHVQTAISSMMDEGHLQAIAANEWAHAVEFFLGEPTLELGATYTLPLSVEFSDSPTMHIEATLGVHGAGDGLVEVWMEEHRDLWALAHRMRRNIEKMTPPGAPLLVPEPTMSVERRRMRMDPRTLGTYHQVKETVTRSRLPDEAEFELLERKVTEVVWEGPLPS